MIGAISIVQRYAKKRNIFLTANSPPICIPLKVRNNNQSPPIIAPAICRDERVLAGANAKKIAKTSAIIPKA